MAALRIQTPLVLATCSALLLVGCGDRAGSDEDKDKDARHATRAEADKTEKPPTRPAPAGAPQPDAGPSCNGQPVSFWLAELRNYQDEKTRTKAVETLGEALVKDKSPEVRKAIVSSMWPSGQAAVPVVAHGVAFGDREVRKALIPILTQLVRGYRFSPAVRQAIPGLMDALQDKDERFRRDVAEALQVMGDEAGAALPALLTASKAQDEGGQAARAALQVIRKAPRSAAPALLVFLKDSEPKVRLKAAAALCELEENDKECLAALLELVKRRDPLVRQEAVYVLSKYTSAAKEVVPVLSDLVANDPDLGTRMSAITALGAIGPAASAAVPVIQIARDSNKQLEQVAKNALNKIEH